MKKINKVLIANRAEIAVRVIRTCKKLGIKTVTLYAEDDSLLPHVWMSDEAYPLGAGALRETYLNQEKIIEIALKSKADAIHPGYGFLSENTTFAKKIKEAGLIFIGPTPENITVMGDKIGSKIEAKKYNLPLIPGYHGENQEAEFLLAEAEKIGYPVLIKASAGGGGKGMRIVHQKDDFFSSLEAAKREAIKSFGNDAVLLEKYINNPRHIEVQVMCDEHDQYFHFFERECSVQRRYQKIIEETPAPHLDQETRLAICESALQIARGIKYRGAGTVEFVLAPDNKFYFLEMNTRLQVEHPITEEVTGFDLVELQIRVAQGEKLNIKQENIQQRGHSIECRICAENPDQDFLPTSGSILQIGKNSYPGIRLDCGYQDGSVIGINYDSMIAKVIVYSSTREEAIKLMSLALDDYFFSGIRSNRSYLKRILKHPQFILGKIHTHFLKDFENDLKLKILTPNELKPMLAALLLTQNSQKNSGEQKHKAKAGSAWETLSNWRNF